MCVAGGLMFQMSLFALPLRHRRKSYATVPRDEVFAGSGAVVPEEPLLRGWWRRVADPPPAVVELEMHALRLSDVDLLEHAQVVRE
jgi:hypothetical protein